MLCSIILTQSVNKKTLLFLHKIISQLTILVWITNNKILSLKQLQILVFSILRQIIIKFVCQSFIARLNYMISGYGSATIPSNKWYIHKIPKMGFRRNTECSNFTKAMFSKFIPVIRHICNLNGIRFLLRFFIVGKSTTWFFIIFRTQLLVYYVKN